MGKFKRSNPDFYAVPKDIRWTNYVTPNPELTKKYNFYHNWDFIAPKIEAGEDFQMMMYGGRSTGKSTDLSNTLLNIYENFGHRFVYVVRNLNDVKRAQGYFRNLDERVILEDDNMFYWYQDGDKKNIGEAVPLTLEMSYKSGHAFPNVHCVTFEEFSLISPEMYLPEEVAKFNELLNTIGRMNQLYTFCVANNTTKMCDYCPIFTDVQMDFDRVHPVAGERIEWETDIEGFDEGLKCILDFVPLGFMDVQDVPKYMRRASNDVAFSGGYATDDEIIRELPKNADIFDYQFKVDDRKYLTFYTGKYCCYCVLYTKERQNISCYHTHTPEGRFMWKTCMKLLIQLQNETNLPLYFLNENSKYVFLQTCEYFNGLTTFTNAGNKMRRG